MKIETERLVLREMRAEDYDALYAVLADSDIMQHYPYTFDEARVRDWTFKYTPFGRIYSYMKATNLPSARTAVSWGCHFAGEYPDDENGVTSVYEMSREEWEAIQTSMEGKA